MGGNLANCMGGKLANQCSCSLKTYNGGERRNEKKKPEETRRRNQKKLEETRRRVVVASTARASGTSILFVCP